MKCGILPVTPFQQNCSLIWCEETMKGAVIDPGGDLPAIEAALKERGVTLERILLTHGHVDHASGAGTLKQHWGVPIEGPHRDDAFLIESLPDQAARYGFPPVTPFEPDRWLEGGDTVTVGNMTLDVRHCPGHTPGHVIFFHAPSNLAFVGDVLFRGSIGRTDLPRGNHTVLIRSIRTQLWPLGNDVTFVPGHGPISTFGEERENNPFVGDGM
jgi:glyoxylase-like metal-dependent hydrolase (beta-lactamase superfamily II)